mgnify:CR=1 FL=1
MSYYGTKLYGSFIYGITTVINSISPDTGPSIGGTAFAVDGEGFDPRVNDDDFQTPPVPNPLLWNSLDAGTGSSTTGSSHLQLSTGAGAGAIAGIESIKTWTDCQCEIQVNLPQITANPGGNVTPIAFQLRVDANNYCRMYIQLSATGAYTINCDVYRGGASVGSYSATTTNGLSYMKILRFGTRVYFYYNNVLIYDNRDFVATAAAYRVYATNNAQAYDIPDTTVVWFYWRTFVAFDNQVVHNPTIVSDFRLRSITPPSLDCFEQDAAYAGLVDFTVVGATSVTSMSVFLYYYNPRLKVMNNAQNSTVLSIIDDDQTLTKTGYDKGL